ncbi:hypothetical protein CEXT_310241 [Caerostris extrusa]|uniref:Uncharacterized protein n=1 Tax=Caerostris extrusa TaxID=172846 RepID=A0AAV4TF92_CAEEX|nr:hypothetical protein CEXT_310241 [Caerostris extrusa]
MNFTGEVLLTGSQRSVEYGGVEGFFFHLFWVSDELDIVRKRTISENGIFNNFNGLMALGRKGLDVTDDTPRSEQTDT